MRTMTFEDRPAKTLAEAAAEARARGYAREEPLEEMLEVDPGEPVDDEEGDDVFGSSFAAPPPRTGRATSVGSYDPRDAFASAPAPRDDGGRASTDTWASRAEAPSGTAPSAPSGATRRERMASRETPRAAPRSPASPLDALLAKHLGRGREKTPRGNRIGWSGAGGETEPVRGG